MPPVEEKTLSFSEISGMLDKAIADIAEKKKTFDKATQAVTIASNSYNDAVNTAKTLRTKLNEELNKSLGSSDQERVRNSG